MAIAEIATIDPITDSELESPALHLRMPGQPSVVGNARVGAALSAPLPTDRALLGQTAIGAIPEDQLDEILRAELPEEIVGNGLTRDSGPDHTLDEVVGTAARAWALAEFRAQLASGGPVDTGG
jgi:hypothetical protein